MKALPGPARAPRRRGFTLIELMIVLAVLATLVTLALPSFAHQLTRHRLKAAAESLATDLNQARFEAARMGRPMHVAFTAGTDWCYAVAQVPGCACGSPRPCQLRKVLAAEMPGLELSAGQDASFDAMGQPTGGRQVLLRSRQGDELQVSVSPLGRTRVCSPKGSFSGYAGC